MSESLMVSNLSVVFFQGYWNNNVLKIKHKETAPQESANINREEVILMLIGQNAIV